MLQALYFAGCGLGTLLSGIAAWRSNRRTKALYTQTSWPRLARCMRENDALRNECNRLRASCRDLGQQLRAALELVDTLKGSPG